jgi:hypothetical protein
MAMYLAFVERQVRSHRVEPASKTS